MQNPKFTLNDNELILYIHGSIYQDKKLVIFNDYRLNYENNWSTIENVTLDNKQVTTSKIKGNKAWLWRVTW